MELTDEAGQFEQTPASAFVTLHYAYQLMFKGEELHTIAEFQPENHNSLFEVKLNIAILCHHKWTKFYERK
jgi:hypothetical protein